MRYMIFVKSAESAGPPPAALDLYRAIRTLTGPAERLEHEIRRYRPAFVVNQTRVSASAASSTRPCTSASMKARAATRARMLVMSTIEGSSPRSKLSLIAACMFRAR